NDTAIPPDRAHRTYTRAVLNRIGTGVDSRCTGVRPWASPVCPHSLSAGKEQNMIRALTFGAAALALVAVGGAQTTTPQKRDPRSIRLRGDRFKPLTYDEMTPAQKK